MQSKKLHFIQNAIAILYFIFYILHISKTQKWQIVVHIIWQMIIGAATTTEFTFIHSALLFGVIKYPNAAGMVHNFCAKMSIDSFSLIMIIDACFNLHKLCALCYCWHSASMNGTIIAVVVFFLCVLPSGCTHYCHLSK